MKFSQLCRASLLGLAVFLSACGSGGLGTPLTRTYDTFNGTFKSLGSIHVNDTVTHLFEEDDGTILYAYSDRYDLSENLNTRVEAYGVISTYEDVDKPLFEVKRIGTPTEEEPEVAVSTVAYKNPALGISFSYSSDWTLVSENSTETVLEGPLAKEHVDVEAMDDSEPLIDMDSTEVKKDLAEFIAKPGVLTSGNDADQETRSTDIRTYVTAHFAELKGVTGELSYVGVDRVVGVRYKTAEGDFFIFVPRDKDLFELHFASLSEDQELRLSNTNAFTAMVASFRFIPEGEADVEETTPVESPSSSTPAPGQVSVSKWTNLESSTFQFKMQVPAAWYYVGGSTGYTFDLKDIEDVNATGVVKLSFNTSTTEGRSSSGGSVSLTKKVESRYYTLTGSAEYETVMQSMLDSIQTTKTE